MTITLTPDLEQALSERARQQGTTPELVALDTLRQHVLSQEEAGESPKAGETMADFFAGYIGVLHSSEHVAGGARMSEDCGKEFAEGLLEKHRRDQP